MSPKGPPFIFFLFCKRMDVQKLPKTPFTFFGTMRLTGEQKNSKNFLKKIQNHLQATLWEFAVFFSTVRLIEVIFLVIFFIPVIGILWNLNI